MLHIQWKYVADFSSKTLQMPSNTMQTVAQPRKIRRTILQPFFRVKSRWISGGVAQWCEGQWWWSECWEKCPRRSSERCWHGLRGITEHVRSLWLSMRYRSNFRLWDLQSTSKHRFWHFDDKHPVPGAKSHVSCRVEDSGEASWCCGSLGHNCFGSTFAGVFEGLDSTILCKGSKNLKLNIITAWLGLLSLGLQLSLLLLPVVLHKAVAEVSKIGNL